MALCNSCKPVHITISRNPLNPLNPLAFSCCVGPSLPNRPGEFARYLADKSIIKLLSFFLTFFHFSLQIVVLHDASLLRVAGVHAEVKDFNYDVSKHDLVCMP